METIEMKSVLKGAVCLFSYVLLMYIIFSVL